MIVKLFSKPSAGKPSSCKACVDYLLKKPDNHAQTLQGDPRLSQLIADSLEFNNTYTAGCLSFEESDIPETQKREIMERFEKTMFAGLEPEQYNIAWVQHTDKGRLELNFVIPNVEMTSGKRLQPYYDKADRPLVENFKQVINHEYKLSDPNAPDKKQTLIISDNLPKDKKQALNAINDGLTALAQKGEIKDRQDVINALEGAGFEIARITPKNISIKTDGQNLRLKGQFYEQDFRFSDNLSTEIRERAREYRADCQERYRTAQRKLDSAITRRRESNISKYPSRASEIHTERTRNLCEHYSIDPKSLQDTTVRHISVNANNDVHNRLFDVESQRNVQGYDRMATIRRDSSKTDGENQTIELWETEQTLRSHSNGDRQRELSERERQEKRHNVQNSSGVTNNDEHRATLRERLDRIINLTKSNAERVISKIREFGTGEQTISREIQRNQPTISEFNAKNGQLKQNLDEVSVIAEKSLKAQQSMGMSL